MTNNEIISKWRGECRHPNTASRGTGYKGGVLTFCTNHECRETVLNPIKMPIKMPKAPDYENDPSAWTPELYQEIEDKGLANMMVTFMNPKVCSTNALLYPKKLAFEFIRSTPAQKSEALARAIMEADNG